MRSPYSQVAEDGSSPFIVTKGKFPWSMIIILLIMGWIIYSGVWDRTTPVINDDVIDYIDDEEIEEEEEEPDVVKVLTWSECMRLKRTSRNRGWLRF